MSGSTEATEPIERHDLVTVTAHCCNAERTVFTERDNSDGWIATDLTVELER